MNSMVEIYQIDSLNQQISCKQYGVTCQKNNCLHIHVVLTLCYQAKRLPSLRCGKFGANRVVANEDIV